MENNLEQLLNSLIEKGWKPRGLDRIKGGIIYCGPKGGIIFQHKGMVFDFCCPDYVLYNGKEYMDYDSYIIYFADDVLIDTKHIFGYRKLLRELCSKESGLWQFVCENCLINEESLDKLGIRAKNPDGFDECDDNCCGDDYQYRLIESSLKDESELEDFLLQNIKLGNED